MPVRIRITLFFASIVFIILLLVCIAVYYISYANTQQHFNDRLKSRAMTTARFLSQSESFDSALLRKIDASTALTLKDKTIQAYDESMHRMYVYSNNKRDVIHNNELKYLQHADLNRPYYFKINNRNAIVYAFKNNNRIFKIIVAADNVEGHENLQELQFILSMCFFGGILIAIAGGYIFSTSLLKPLKKIADDLRTISAQNLQSRIPEQSGRDEWNYLIKTLNELLNRLEESFETQQRFISNASHELSTPLTSISSQLEVSLQKERAPKEYRKVMESILQDVMNLSKLTQTLLEVAKASGTAGGLEIRLVRIDEILLRMPHELRKINREHQVVLDFENLPDDDKTLLFLGNEDLIFSAIKNIILNACKYSSDQVAHVRLTIHADTILIRIKDKGHGIAPEEVEHIFQPFYRGKEEYLYQNGFGLGLSLSYRILKLHRGEISVHSVVDQGTSFIVKIPVASFIDNIS